MLFMRAHSSNKFRLSKIMMNTRLLDPCICSKATVCNLTQTQVIIISTLRLKDKHIHKHITSKLRTYSIIL